MTSKYGSRRAQQDADRDDLASRIDGFLPELSAMWDGDDTLEVATITLTRAKDGTGCLAIVKGSVLESSKDFALVEQFGGRAVLFYGFGADPVEALCSVEVLLRRGEVSLQLDRYAARPQAAGASRRRSKAPKTHKGD